MVWLIELLLFLGFLGAVGLGLLLVLLGPLILIGLVGLALIGLIVGLVGGAIGLVFGLLGNPAVLGLGALLIGAVALLYLANRRGYIRIRLKPEPKPRSSPTGRPSRVRVCPRCGALVEPGQALCPHCRLELPRTLKVSDRR